MAHTTAADEQRRKRWSHVVVLFIKLYERAARVRARVLEAENVWGTLLSKVRPQRVCVCGTAATEKAALSGTLRRSACQSGLHAMDVSNASVCVCVRIHISHRRVLR